MVSQRFSKRESEPLTNVATNNNASSMSRTLCSRIFQSLLVSPEYTAVLAILKTTLSHLINLHYVF